MLELVANKNEWICEWVAKRLSKGYRAQSFGPCSTLGVMRDGKLEAGIIFNNYRAMSRDIHLTIASDSARWMNRKVLKAVFNYVFLQQGCVRLTVTIGRKNKRARRLAAGDGKKSKGLGFKQEGVVRKAMDGIEDAIVFGMLKKECRWLGDKEHGKKHARIA